MYTHDLLPVPLEDGVPLVKSAYKRGVTGQGEIIFFIFSFFLKPQKLSVQTKWRPDLAALHRAAYVRPHIAALSTIDVLPSIF